MTAPMLSSSERPKQRASFNRPARIAHTADALGNARSPRTRCGESRSPAPRPRTPCEVPVISRDLKHHLLGYFVLHIIGKLARFVGAFAPVLRVVNNGGRHKVALTRPLQVARTSPPRFHPINQLTTTRRREFVDGNRRSRPVEGLVTGRDFASTVGAGPSPWPRN